MRTMKGIWNLSRSLVLPKAPIDAVRARVEVLEERYPLQFGAPAIAGGQIVLDVRYSPDSLKPLQSTGTPMQPQYSSQIMRLPNDGTATRELNSQMKIFVGANAVRAVRNPVSAWINARNNRGAVLAAV